MALNRWDVIQPARGLDAGPIVLVHDGVLGVAEADRQPSLGLMLRDLPRLETGHPAASAMRAFISLRTSAIDNGLSDEKWSEPFVWS
jgi:hypothetical protein